MTNESGLSGTLKAYNALLESVGHRADDLDDRPVVVHWPHVGTAYHGVVFVGQAVYGWPDDFGAGTFRTPEGRAEAIQVAQERAHARLEPIEWIATHPVRNSPFWSVARQVVGALEPPASAPWYARFAWVNLYPAAPERPPGNPGGPLRAAQDPLLGDLVRAIVEMLEARTVIALVGPYWWPAGAAPYFADLSERPRPLLRSGVIGGRAWVVGWHPGGASRRGFGPTDYARRLITEVTRLRSPL